jgi:V/A-type H+-transporting ATPase subunit D
MAIQYQYNKTSLQNLEKQLKIRERALPTIKNKESALRLEVKKAKAETRELEKKLEMLIENYREMHALWTEFNAELIKVKDVELGVRKVAGVRIPVLEEVLFEIAPYSMFHAPKWYAGGSSVVLTKLIMWSSTPALLKTFLKYR